MTATARALTILSRFPRHLGADDDGKLFSNVVEGIGHELDVKSIQLVGVRRAHDLGDAAQEADLLLLAGVHDFKPEDFEITRIRLDAALAVQSVLANPSAAAADVQAAMAKLPDLFGLPIDSFPTWPGEGSNAQPAQVRLAAAIAALVSYSSRLDLLRTNLDSAIAVHRAGNGTVGALLHAAAAYLQLDIESVTDSTDLYWHLATCQDHLRLIRPEPPHSRSATTTLAPSPDVLALEENPLREQDSGPIDRRHADRFSVLRSGYETVPATVRVVGVGDRTVQPMVVNLDTGLGFTFTGSVPDGQELRFEADGRVTLAGASVSRASYSFSGGVFADAGKHFSADFVFAGESVTGQVATFAVTEPVIDAFDPGAVFPHPESLLQAPSLVVGESRWAFFVRSAAFGSVAGTPAGELAVPVFDAAVFNGSVFEPDTSVGSASSGQVGFSWQEHEPFAARLWIPLRFSTLDVSGELAVTERLRLVLGRHRGAAIHVYVEYADDRWTLPGGIVRDTGSTEALGTVVVGTALWSSQTPTPT